MYRALNGKLLNYVVQGEGMPVVLIHGMAASLYDWENLLPVLSGAGFRAYAVDLLGHGDSQKPVDPRMYTHRALLATLEGWLGSLEIDQPFMLVGHSLGGHLSLSYSLRHPNKVCALVLIDPFYSLKQLPPIFRLLHRRPSPGVKILGALPENLIERVMRFDLTTLARLSSQVRRQIAADLKRASPNILHIPRSLPDLTHELSHIQVPAQVIWGEDDLTLNPASFPRLVSILSNASGHPISNCGHQPHVGKPEQVNRLVVEFLAAVNAQGLNSKSGLPKDATWSSN